MSWGLNKSKIDHSVETFLIFPQHQRPAGVSPLTQRSVVDPGPRGSSVTESDPVRHLPLLGQVVLQGRAAVTQLVGLFVCLFVFNSMSVL